MIILLLENIPYEQDIRELFMAFYPGEEYKYNISEKNENTRLILKGSAFEDQFIFDIYFIYQAKEANFKLNIDEDRKINKNNIKREIYKILEEINKKALPWGTLTGIRPTKLIMELLEKNKNTDYIKNIMKQTYLISDDKLDLCLDIALREKSILEKISYETAFSLYIGIPFCPSTCAYCSFTSYPIDKWKNKTYLYINSLCRELEQISKLVKNKTLQAIYIGGGTPSSIEAFELDKIISCIENNFNLKALLEFSVEFGRPDSIDSEKLEILKKHKVSRISINPQTMHDRTLKIIGRRQSREEFLKAFYLARELGFDNINTDIILGLPGENLSDLSYTLEELKKLSPESITVHTLAIKRAAKLNINKEAYYGLQIDNNSKMIDLSKNACIDMGLFPYYMYRQKNMIGNFENVAYAKPKKECIYNILIMEEKQNIIACGAGTSTKLIYPKENRLSRIENVKDPKLYIERIDDIIAKKADILEAYYNEFNCIKE